MPLGAAAARTGSKGDGGSPESEDAAHVDANPLAKRYRNRRRPARDAEDPAAVTARHEGYRKREQERRWRNAAKAGPGKGGSRPADYNACAVVFAQNAVATKMIRDDAMAMLDEAQRDKRAARRAASEEPRRSDEVSAAPATGPSRGPGTDASLGPSWKTTTARPPAKGGSPPSKTKSAAAGDQAPQGDKHAAAAKIDEEIAEMMPAIGAVSFKDLKRLAKKKKAALKA
mmetsp:Transcript_16304/g.42324  ORF Transcript_16304/g.42324 Transcript_16304/m.42324 type:complete len:229 (-) Transcript_16304:151-837(-)